MKIYAVNASPRRKGNTATVLQHVLDGAKAAGGDSVETELVHFYSLEYTGCRSCFACKMKNGRSYGRCAVKDGITPLLEAIPQADAVVFGSPIYFGGVSGMLRCFEERLLFPFLTYTEGHASIAPKKLATGFVYTMNVPAPLMEEWEYPKRLSMMEGYAGHIFGSEPKVLYVNNTVQFSDYAKYVCTMFDGAEKAKWREEHFPEDCRKAEEMGATLVGA